MTYEVTDDNFETIMPENDKTIILDFWGSNCGPCKILNPHLEDLSSKYFEEVFIGKVNVETNSGLMIKFGIRSIPTLLFIKDGQIVHKHVGTTSKKMLEQKLVDNLI